MAIGTYADDAAPLPLQRACQLDPPDGYRELRSADPVSRLALPDGKLGWLLTRYADVRAVLADPRFSSRRGFLFNPFRPMPTEPENLVGMAPGQFLGMDPPEHTRYRKTLTGQFTVRRMRVLEPQIARIVGDHLDHLAAAGAPADLVQAFALPVPSLVICELLGVPYADRADFQCRSSTLLCASADLQVVFQARAEMREYMHGLVQAKRRAPGDDLLSDLIRHDSLVDAELSTMGSTLLIAGHETTANMLALGTLALLQHPGQLAALRARPELVDHAVEELLRYLSIIQFGLIRTALEDVTIADRHIRAGEPVVCSLAAANRDPAHFPEPEQLDVMREYSPHLAFGHGVHQCLGQQLARVELRIGLGALLERFPGLRLAVPPEEVPMRDDMLVYGVRELPVTW